MAIVAWTNGQVSPQKPVSLPTLSTVTYTATDTVESQSVTKTPLITDVPQSIGYYTGNAYAGTTTINSITSRDIWITG